MIVGYTVNTVVEFEDSMNSSPWKIIFTNLGPNGIFKNRKIYAERTIFLPEVR